MNEQTHTRFKMKIGAAEIEYEGNPDFLKNEIMPTVDKILGMVESRTDLQRANVHPELPQPKLTKPSEAAFAGEESEIVQTAPSGQGTSMSLASYIKAKKGESNQVRRFLSAGAWLFHRGQKELSPPTIAKALRDHQQARLSNPADALNKNVQKGFCEKTGTGFFITPEGWKSLDEPQ